MCPADCPYLVASHEHPPAAIVRQQQRDIALLMESVRDLNDRQSQLFLMIGAFLLQYEAPELQRLLDQDVSAAASALAATLETEARGVIYEHRATSLPAERLVGELKKLLAEARGQRGSAFDRDTAFVLRRIEQGVNAVHQAEPGHTRGFLDLLARTLRRPGHDAAAEAAAEPAPSRLIVP